MFIKQTVDFTKPSTKALEKFVRGRKAYFFQAQLIINKVTRVAQCVQGKGKVLSSNPNQVNFLY